MQTVTSYTDARARLASLCDEAESSREPIIIKRRGHADIALIAADELAGILETTHLLSSPVNVQRLVASLRRAFEKEIEPETLEQLREELDLVP